MPLTILEGQVIAFGHHGASTLQGQRLLGHLEVELAEPDFRQWGIPGGEVLPWPPSLPCADRGAVVSATERPSAPISCRTASFSMRRPPTDVVLTSHVDEPEDRIGRPPPPPPTPVRSSARLAPATFQPSPGAPMTLATGTRTSSKNTSLKSVVPVISRRGRTSMPGVVMSRMKAVDARRAFERFSAGQQVAEVGPLGPRAPHLLPHDHVVLTVELPPGPERGQVAACIGLAEQLRPDVIAPGHRREICGSLLIGAEVL